MDWSSLGSGGGGGLGGQGGGGGKQTSATATTSFGSNSQTNSDLKPLYIGAAILAVAIIMAALIFKGR